MTRDCKIKCFIIKGKQKVVINFALKTLVNLSFVTHYVEQKKLNPWVIIEFSILSYIGLHCTFFMNVAVIPWLIKNINFLCSK